MLTHKNLLISSSLTNKKSKTPCTKKEHNIKKRMDALKKILARNGDVP